MSGQLDQSGSEVLFFSRDKLLLDITEYVGNTNTVYWVLLVIWLVVEIAFAVFIFWTVHPKIQEMRPPDHQPYRGGSAQTLVLQIIKVVKSLKQTYSFQRFCEGWFLGAKIDDIKNGNVVSFLSWALYCDTPNKLGKDQLDLVMASVAEVQSAFNHKFEEGYNSDITHCRFTHEPIPFIHRPLAIHAVAAVGENTANFFLLRCRGFSRTKTNGVTYWIKTSTNNSKSPILLLHGICSGWFFYASLISMLSHDRTVIMIETDAIKIKSLVFDMPSPEDFITTIKNIMKIHNINQFSVVGHSFGSICASWLVKFSPQLVSHLTLLDPVSLLLALPDVAYNFIYRSPTTLMEHAIFFMASRELTISKMLHRDFYWYNNLLYLDEVPAHIGVIVGIAGKDEILNSNALREYVSNTIQSRTLLSDSSNTPSSCHNKLHYLYWDDFSHGQCLVTSTALKEITGLLAKNESTLFNI